VCIHDQFLPRAGSVPANIAAIAWDPGYDAANDVEGAARLPSLECTAANGSTRDLRFVALPEDRHVHLKLSEPLVAGERCTLRSGVSGCAEANAEYLQDSAEFQVAESSPIPESLGLLAVAGPKYEEIELAADASCSENVAACVVRTSVVFNDQAISWKDALLYETIVDGEPFSAWRDLALPDELGGLYNGRDADVVYALIGETPENVRTVRDLDPGEHTLAIRARLPGSDLVLATPEVSINLDCGHAARVPLARNEVASGSESCTVSPHLGSSRRPAGALVFSFLAAVLLAARRRTQTRA
jgi:hypothetical protein